MMNYKVPLLLLLLCVSLYYFLSPAPPLSDEQLSTHLKDKVVLICGASSGIGEEMAYQLAGHGARLVLVARSRDKLGRVKEEAVKRGAGGVETISFDFTDVAGSSLVINETIARFGRLDYLVSNHASITFGPVLGFPHQQDPAYVERMFRVNVFSHIELALHALPHLEASKGHMFFTSSMVGEVISYRATLYSSTKHALNGFFYSLQQELLAKESPVSLTVGSLSIIWTKDLSRVLADADYPDWIKGSPEECARQMIEAYVTRPRTMTYLRFPVDIHRAMWYFDPSYHERIIKRDKPKGAKGNGFKETVDLIKRENKLSEEINFQQGYGNHPAE